MESIKPFRAVSNLDSEGCHPAYHRSRSNLGGQSEVRHFDKLGAAKQWLLRTGAGGIIYLASDDSVAAAVPETHREFRCALAASAVEAFTGTLHAAKVWLGERGGWVEQFDPAVNKFVTIYKTEATV
jgi:hypothetical protein